MSEAPASLVDVPLKAKTSDLGVRTASAVVMLAVAGGALWLGGWWWRAFASLATLGIYWEWARLARGSTKSLPTYVIGLVLGAGYIGLAGFCIASLGGDLSTGDHWGRFFLIALLALVIGTDVGAYLVGRSVGGPKIAPNISPSKTWSGLLGGMLGGFGLLLFWSYLTSASALMTFPVPVAGLFSSWREAILPCLFTGIVGAIIAQAGDFFESWMKRKAGVKDSSNLIPGHGGLFDRTDGLIALAFVYLISSHAGIDWFLA